TLEGDSGTHDLGCAVVVVGFEVQTVLELAAQVFAPGLGTEDTRLERKL
ncbi:hypothetical protein LCGC14_2160060, partial [marine sediment metagenome]